MKVRPLAIFDASRPPGCIRATAQSNSRLYLLHDILVGRQHLFEVALSRECLGAGARRRPSLPAPRGIQEFRDMVDETSHVAGIANDRSGTPFLQDLGDAVSRRGD